jgi:FMN-dependent NADH-azoreductase
LQHLLQINSSIFGDSGQSTRLAQRFVGLWKALDAMHTVAIRNLGDCTIPHLDAARFGALRTPPDDRTGDQQAVVAFSDELIAELRSADVVVFAVPMYNFLIPSGLKAYFDHVARAGETFRYTATGPVGLLTGRRAVVTSARGGFNGGRPNPIALYMSVMLEFLGFEVVEFIGAEGLAISPEARSRGLAEAEQAILATLQKFTPAVAGRTV